MVLQENKQNTSGTFQINVTVFKTFQLDLDLFFIYFFSLKTKSFFQISGWHSASPLEQFASFPTRSSGENGGEGQSFLHFLKNIGISAN